MLELSNKTCKIEVLLQEETTIQKKQVELIHQIEMVQIHQQLISHSSFRLYRIEYRCLERA